MAVAGHVPKRAFSASSSGVEGAPDAGSKRLAGSLGPEPVANALTIRRCQDFLHLFVVEADVLAQLYRSALGQLQSETKIHRFQRVIQGGTKIASIA